MSLEDLVSHSSENAPEIVEDTVLLHHAYELFDLGKKTSFEMYQALTSYKTRHRLSITELDENYALLKEGI